MEARHRHDDSYAIANPHCLVGPAECRQLVPRVGLDSPALGFAGLVRDLDEKLRMRIDQPHTAYRAFDADLAALTVAVVDEIDRVRVVGGRRSDQQQRRQASQAGFDHIFVDRMHARFLRR